MNPDVANKPETTGKGLGGVTGKDFLPGHSGNPSGRPRKRPLSDRYEAITETPLPEDMRQALRLKKGATYGDGVALALARAAIKGKLEAAREMGEGIEGKPTQRVELGDEPEGIRIEVVNIGETTRAATKPGTYPGCLIGRETPVENPTVFGRGNGPLNRGSHILDRIR